MQIFMVDDEQQQLELALAAVSANDTSLAISVLYQAYGKRLKNMIALRLDRRLAGRVDPEDILQDAFIVIINKLPQFGRNCEIPLFLWMRAIVQERIIATRRRHLIADKRDARRECNGVVAQNSNENSTTTAQVLLSDESSISGQMIRAEQHDQLEAALACLEGIDREIILLRIYENLTNQEVALILNIESSAASKRFLRATDRLGEILRSRPGCDSALFSPGS